MQRTFDRAARIGHFRTELTIKCIFAIIFIAWLLEFIKENIFAKIALEKFSKASRNHWSRVLSSSIFFLLLSLSLLISEFYESAFFSSIFKKFLFFPVSFSIFRTRNLFILPEAYFLFLLVFFAVTWGFRTLALTSA